MPENASQLTGDKHQPALSGRHSVHALKYDGIRLEEQVEYCVDERQIEAGEKDDALSTEHFDGSS